jgi:glutamate-1-semialdehyde-2,1-aminomutase
MSKGQELAAAAREVIPGGLNTFSRQVGSPHAFAGADGAYVTDVDGRRYLDYHAGSGAILLGYNHPVVNEAVIDAIGGVDQVGLGVTELEVELARRIVAAIPSAEQTVAMASGSEAVAHAVRLARAVTGRPLLMKFQGMFHGWHDAVARNLVSPPERAFGRDPLSAGILDPAIDATVIAELNRLDSVKALFAEHPERIAAVIVEPIAHNVGALLPEHDFLPGLRALTEEHGALLIFDEVITGFRHALGGYQQICGVLPDLTVFGKAMGNGFPAAGIAGRRDLMRRFLTAGGDVLLAGTFNGNRVTAAASVATIGYLRDHPEFYEHTHALGRRVRAGLASIVDELGIAATVTGFGGVFALYFAAPPVTGYRDLARDDAEASVVFNRHMTDAGILMRPAPMRRHHISGAHTTEDIDRTLDVARDVLHRMRRAGAAPTQRVG